MLLEDAHVRVHLDHGEIRDALYLIVHTIVVLPVPRQFPTVYGLIDRCSRSIGPSEN